MSLVYSVFTRTVLMVTSTATGQTSTTKFGGTANKHSPVTVTSPIGPYELMIIATTSTAKVYRQPAV